jgi:integrase
LTERVKRELLALPSLGASEQVFPIKDFKRAWETTKRLAGIQDLRFHDLRTSCITGLQVKGVGQGIAGRIAGHSQVTTTARYYTVADSEIVAGVREALDRANAEKESWPEVVE